MPTHGSLTKAGKVRSKSPLQKKEHKPSPIPRERNRDNYVKRFILKRKSGQNWLIR
ncbi:MAG: 30S ribosomal protein S30e [Nitrososphaeria archaeon]